MFVKFGCLQILTDWTKVCLIFLTNFSFHSANERSVLLSGEKPLSNEGVCIFLMGGKTRAV